MKTVPLGEVADIERKGVDPSEVDPSTWYLGLEHIDRGGRINGRVTCEEAELASTKFAFTDEHVLFGKLRPNLGKVARPDFCGICSTDILPIRSGPHLDRGYLVHYLRQQTIVDLATSRASGANLPRLNPGVLAQFPVPLPPLDEQRRIAAILDHAGALRTKRRQILAHLDALPQAIFRAMFGDPLSAHGNRVRIGDVATVVTGNSPPRSRPELFGGRLEWIKSDNLGGLVASSATETLSDLGRGLARTAPAGSVLVTCIAGSPQSIGKASLTDREVAFNQQINAVLPCDGLEPHFLLAQLHTAPDLIRRKSTGGMKGLVNKSAFQSIEVLAPPFSSQRRFSARLAGIARYRSHIESAALHQDELFASLQSRAFRGEL